MNLDDCLRLVRTISAYPTQKLIIHSKV